MKYSDNIDLLVSSIIYLGSHTHWWGRSVPNMTRALNQDPERLRAIFEGFPGLFRRSWSKNEQGEHSYSLQARYAQYESKEGEEPDSQTLIPVLQMDKQKLLLEFVQRMAEQELVSSRARWTLFFSGLAAALSAITTVVVATGMLSLKQPEQKAAIKQGLERQTLSLR